MSGSGQATVWVHVSTLMKWDRPPVGVVRVEREYCQWLLAHSAAQPVERVRFCVYDDTLIQFTEVDAALVRERLARRLSSQPAVPRELVGWRASVKRAWRSLHPHLPAGWPQALSAAGRRTYHHLLQAARSFRAAMARMLAGPAANTAPAAAAFGAGDRFVSLGADWAYLNQPLLFRIKREAGLRVTLICYDAIPVLLPHLFVGVLSREDFALHLVDLAWCADSVLCISECTRRDFEGVMTMLGGPRPPTQVIRLGSQVHAPDAEVEQSPRGLPLEDHRPFVLYVSTIERRKNHEVLYRAWTRLREQGLAPHRLVFVGMRGWGVDDLFNDLQLDERVRGDIVSLNHVSDAELAWLYRHAAFTVFPSLYEGWGLPVVESLAWGKFCLASNAASLPEAGSDWVEYLDPWDLPAWVDKLAFYMQHPQAVQERNARIAREFRPVTWIETAAAIHDAVINGTSRSKQS
jgi:glycosyltransferase involved in cell wall biosynthesis